MELIDFDQLYHEYVKIWTKKNFSRLKCAQSPEAFIEEIYAEWKDTPSAKLGGKTPKEYFEGFPCEKLTDAVREYIVGGVSVPSPLLDRLSECNSEDKLLNELENPQNPDELLVIAAETLEEKGSKKLYPALANILLSEEYNSEIREAAAEILSNNADSVEKTLIEKIDPDSTCQTQRYIADVLVYCKGKQKIYNLLVKLFESGANNQLYAAYLGMYEDSRAISVLQKRLQSPDTGYVEFLEIRNSIERLGGEVTLDKDFSDDPDFKALKHIK